MNNFTITISIRWKKKSVELLIGPLWMCTTGLILTTICHYWKRISKMASKYWATCWQVSPSPLKLRREESQSLSWSPPSLRSRSLSGLCAFFLALCAQWIRSAVVKREFVIVPVLIRIIIVIIVMKTLERWFPALGRKRQLDLCEFRTSPVYRASFRTAVDTQRNPVSQKPHLSLSSDHWLDKRH